VVCTTLKCKHQWWGAQLEWWSPLVGGCFLCPGLPHPGLFLWALHIAWEDMAGAPGLVGFRECLEHSIRELWDRDWLVHMGSPPAVGQPSPSGCCWLDENWLPVVVWIVAAQCVTAESKCLVHVALKVVLLALGSGPVHLAWPPLLSTQLCLGGAA
jgi:hypothetical protein